MKKWKKCLLGLLAAFLDETLQLFSGRGSMVADVWLDFAGVVFGVAVITLGRWIAGQMKDVYRGKADRGKADRGKADRGGG